MTGKEIIAVAALIVAVMGGQVAMWRWMVTKMKEDRDASIERDADLHSRINDVKDNYARRDDLMEHIKRIEAGQNSLAEVVTQFNVRFDAFLLNHNKAETP